MKRELQDCEEAKKNLNLNLTEDEEEEEEQEQEQEDKKTVKLKGNHLKSQQNLNKLFNTYDNEEVICIIKEDI